MRPQHIAAENILFSHDLDGGIYASMRPQHIAAENVTRRFTPACSSSLQ